MFAAKVVLSFLIVFCCFNLSFCYNLLLVFAIPGRSLSILGEAFVRNLLDDGHEVTYITAFPIKDKPQRNFKEIEVSSLVDELMTGKDMFNLTFLIENKADLKNDPMEFMDIGYAISRLTLEHPNVQKLLNDKNQKFDGVIADNFESELFSGLAAYYNCPMIWSYSLGVDWKSLNLVHEPSNPAYTADYLSMNVPPLSFLQRVEELWNQVHYSWLKRHVMLPEEKFLYKKVFGPLVKSKGDKLIPYEDLVYNASLILCNTHHAVGRIPPIPQSYKLIGGFHINVPKALPTDLQTVMDNAKHGVIYFSLGSIWNSHTMPKVVVDNLLKMFQELPQTIIWKFESDLLNLPKNVHTIKWAPQQSILAHPNCVLFITHGGLLSGTEAIHFGVPIVGVPILFDHFININKAIAMGIGSKAELTYNLPKDLKKAILTMLNDKQYRKKVKELSEIYHDRPVPPNMELRHWVRHVVRTRGAAHLQSPALLVSWLQKLYLDLILVIVILILVIFIVLRKAVRKVLTKKPVESKKTN